MNTEQPTSAATKPLPEKYRLARNIEAGYELNFTHPDTGESKWVPVRRVLHITAPMKVSVFFFDAPVWPEDNEGRVSVHPKETLMSRRPAAVSPVADKEDA